MHGSRQRTLKQTNLARTLLGLREIESHWWVQFLIRYLLLEIIRVR